MNVSDVLSLKACEWHCLINIILKIIISTEVRTQNSCGVNLKIKD